MNKDEFYAIVGRDAVVNTVVAAPTPAYLYFKQLVLRRYEDLKRCLPKSFHVYYAVKANPNSVILQELSSLGVGADVASLGELRRALASGMKAENIEFSGPGKTEEELTYAVQHHISSINTESLHELENIIRISRQLRVKAGVGIRINPCRSAEKAGIKMSGDTQFGIPLNQVAEALTVVRANKDAALFSGIHVHAGSQILSGTALVENFRMILDLALEISNLGILPINKINYGGGWGISYFSTQSSLDMKQVTEGLKEIFGDAKYSKLSQIRHIVEPGRFLVGECGLYVTQVLYRKEGMRKKYLIVDGGMHQHYLLAGGMGQVIRRNFEIDVVSTHAQASQTPRSYDIAGCLCTPQDILANDFRYEREIHVGDRIVFFNSGAYGLTASPVNFLGHEPPPEIIF